jgi:hypothetical protein
MNRTRISLYRERRDPRQPRKNLTSWLFFCREIRPQVRKEFPNYNFVQTSQELARRWRALSVAEKFVSFRRCFVFFF